ncbi:hypothetical protein QCA50_021151 [Cerrena zonata]|uniref:Uncharacterized protein n=1 Tax=Cerrena zonata TaxID=2478898 RepID=A0AAW0FEJ1_9APHY
MPTLVGLCHDDNWRDITLEELRMSFRSLLSRFTLDPAAFRTMMRDTNCIISGSTALHFLLREPSSWTPGDTDILVAPAYFDTTLRFILALPGAAITYDSQNVPPGVYHSINATLKRLVKVTTNMTTFDVMMSKERSPYHPVVHYWTTLVMNALTADFFVCAYPTLTFSHRGAMKKYFPPPSPFEKYIERGFTFFAPGKHLDGSLSCTTSIACPRRQRYFGDDYCLVFPFVSAAHVDKLGTELADSNMTSAWQLGGSPCNNIDCFLATPRIAVTMIVNGGWQAGLQTVEEA